MISSETSLREPRRFARVALTALVVGLGVAAVSAVPLSGIAFAEKGGNGNGGGNGGGHGGGNGGGHGNGGGNGNGGGQDHGNGGQGSAHSGKSDTSDDGDDDGSSLKGSGAGKLNGFLHASPQALRNASPNSAIGKIAKGFGAALSEYAKAQAETDPDNPDDPNNPDDPDETSDAPTVDDLGAILAGATNKKVTGEQVEAIIDKIAKANPDDEALGDLADNMTEDTAQDIADAANAAKSGEAADDADDDGSDDTADGSDGTDDTSGDAPDETVTN